MDGDRDGMPLILLLVHLIYRGFGSRSRDVMCDPTVERVGKCSPGGDQYYSTSSFWKTRWEMRPMYTIKGRELIHCSKEAPESPANYIPQKVTGPHAFPARVKKPYLPDSLTRKPLNISSLSPSPSTYHILPLLGTGSKVSFQARHIDANMFRKSLAQPGPAEYTTRSTLGDHRPRYSIAGRSASSKNPSTQSPGPGDHHIRNIFDKYNICPANYVPVFLRAKSA